MRRTLVTGLLTAALALGSAAVADAATVEYGETALFYTAAPGEVNRMTVTGAEGEDRAVEIVDEAGIAPGNACSLVAPDDPTRVRCVPPPELNDRVARDFRVELGDQADTLDVRSRLLQGRLQGGPGDDELTAFDSFLSGNTGNDTLISRGRASAVFTGGRGDDVMVARLGGGLFRENGRGNGSDVMRVTKRGGGEVEYTDRTRGVRVDLDGKRDDGERGERDLVSANLSHITGGRGNDVLVGDEKRNALTGVAGSDMLIGRGGRDDLIASEEQFDTDRRGDRLRAGAGADQVTGSDRGDTIRPGPGRDEIYARKGPDRIFTADGNREVIECGAGRDRAAADASEFPLDCEQVRRPRGGGGVAVPLDASTFRGDPVGPKVNVGCPADAPSRCVGSLSVVNKGRRVARRRFSIRRGEIGGVDFRLPRLRRSTLLLVARSRDRAGRLRTVRARIEVLNF